MGGSAKGNFGSDTHVIESGSEMATTNASFGHARGVSSSISSGDSMSPDLTAGGMSSSSNGGMSAGYNVAILGADDKRWVPGMRMDDEGIPTISSHDEGQHNRWSAQLARTDLG